jgi:hypothetical protein
MRALPVSIGARPGLQIARPSTVGSSMGFCATSATPLPPQHQHSSSCPLLASPRIPFFLPSLLLRLFQIPYSSPLYALRRSMLEVLLDNHVPALRAWRPRVRPLPIVIATLTFLLLAYQFAPIYHSSTRLSCLHGDCTPAGTDSLLSHVHNETLGVRWKSRHRMKESRTHT